MLQSLQIVVFEPHLMEQWKTVVEKEVYSTVVKEVYSTVAKVDLALLDEMLVVDFQ
jgi:hypothetical protein